MAAEASEVWQAANAKGISRLAAAMAFHETKNHSYHCGNAPQPCIPLSCKNCYAMTGPGPTGQQDGRWAVYGSYAEATRLWCTRILDPQGPYKGATTIAELIHIYAPASDGNDELRYAQVVCDEINRLPLVTGEAPATTGNVVDLSAPPVKTWPVGADPFDVIAGGADYADDYGFLMDYGLPYYEYIVGHGGSSPTQHPGIDLGAGYGTPLYMPIPGTVICRGTAGEVCWGQGCGFYNDYGDGASGTQYGIGNLTFMLDGGETKLTIGHVRDCYVDLGQHVEAGQLIGTIGGMNGAHVHVETAVQRNGSYWMVEPRQRMLEEMAKHPPVPLPKSPNPFTKPTIYSLASDYASFGLTKSQAQKVLGNCFPGRNGGQIEGVVLHIQEGITTGSLNWWATGPNVQASCNVIVNRDGSILRVIPDDSGAWCNGDVKSPSAKGQKLIGLAGGLNLNCVTVNIEAEGYSKDDHPAVQQEGIAWMCAEWMRRHGLTTADIYRHADINSVDRAHCPGSYFDPVLAMLQEAGL